ncbi:MAG: thiamine biosynthesis protein ApbE [Burkholderiales bacterium RIFCSPLOWO2_12_FULL_61_40]|nr:MAG: thiamine biosynthesis protein ApbE [Burkholderiales bacterium RIFCSPLOWO2_12_FULL_61_40]
MRSPSTTPIQFRRRQVVFALPLLACGLVIAPAQASVDVYQSSRTLMGTRVDLTLQGSDVSALPLAAEAAFAEMVRLADMMSRFHSTSALNAINLAAGVQPVPVPPELMQVLQMARLAAQNSAGRFDATVGSLRGWDFGARHSSIPTAQQVASQLSLVGQKNGLVLDTSAGTAYLAKRGMRLDLGGIAKLPILQAGMQQIKRLGISNAMLNGGGDVLVAGQLNGRPWHIGLRDPRQPEKLLGAVTLNEGFIAASGDYERFVMQGGKRLHHILDPKTGYPTHGPHGVALISTQLDAINGLGTAIMVAGAKEGRAWVEQIHGLDALIVDADNSLWLSPGMARRLVRGA